MSARLWSLVAWALVAASAVFWGLKLWSRPAPVPAHASVAATVVPLRGDVTRVLGADPVVATPAVPEAPAPDTRLTLIGVFSPKGNGHAREGLALISVDGKPAKTYRVGAVVDGDRVLQAVSMRGANLGPAGGATQVSLNLSPVAEAAQGRPNAERPTSGPRFPHALPTGQVPGPIPGSDTPPPQQTETHTPGQDRAALR